MASPRLAITATVADCDLWLADWIAHHVAVADQLFIWVDNPAEIPAVAALRSDRVTILPGQQFTRPSRLTQILARQDANADAALQLSAMAGIDWLVHIDADELLVPLHREVWQSAAPQLTFTNHECVPVWQAARPLAEVALFKANGRHPFLLYGNGKSAVRVGRPPVAVRAAGPHGFQGPDCAAQASDGAVILHYACATYDIWWRKYARLGAFSDHWMDQKDAPIELPFHLQSRDVVAEALRTGDQAPAQAFFRTLMLAPETPGLIHTRRDSAGQVHLA